MTLGQGKIESRMGSHEQTEWTKPKHSQLRRLFKQVMTELDEILPAGREREKALTDLETASMWAHKSVATQAPVIREEHPTFEQEITSPPMSEETMRLILRKMIIDKYVRLPNETVVDLFRRLVSTDLITEGDFKAVFPNKSLDA